MSRDQSNAIISLADHADYSQISDLDRNELVTLVAQLLWTGRDLQRTVQALLGQRKRKRRALQDYEAFDDYFDEVDWAGLLSRAGYIRKKSIVLTKLEKLGLTNSKEMTVKKTNSTLICTTYDDVAKIAEHTKISHYE